MNIVYFGTSEFAVPPLRELLSSANRVLAVITQPDKKKGRKLKISPSPVKALAESMGIPVFQPSNASDAESVKLLRNLAPDLQVVVSFGQILKKDVINIPKICSVNIHGSLLPRYRGAAPTNWAIINGDKVSGITIIKMNERMDEGDIILSREMTLDPRETNITLNEKMSEMGAGALLDLIGYIDMNKIPALIKQDDKQASYAPKLKKEDGLIDWKKSSRDIHNRVRGLIPWPGAYTFHKGKMLKIMATELSGRSSSSEGAVCGQVIDVQKGKGIVVLTGSEELVITHLQLEGKKILDADSFLRGHPIEKGYVLG